MTPLPTSPLFLSCLLVMLTGMLSNCGNGSDTETNPLKHGVDESYKPDHPMEFPHDIHVNDNGIDCTFCHNQENDGKNPGIPAEEVCFKCHKQINGNQHQDSM